MLDFATNTWRELNEELNYVALHLRNWWAGMSDGEQLFFVGIISSVLLLLALRRPAKRKNGTYGEPDLMGNVQQFMFAATVLIVFTFGIDIAIERAA